MKALKFFKLHSAHKNFGSNVYVVKVHQGFLTSVFLEEVNCLKYLVNV